MFKKIDQTDFKTFHEWRMEGVGASDVGLILGVSPYGDSSKLMEEKVKGTVTELNNFIRSRADQVEQKARAVTSIDYNSDFDPISFYDDNNPHRRVSLDGYSAPLKMILEAKYVGKVDFDDLNADSLRDVFPHYYAQVQYQFILF